MTNDDESVQLVKDFIFNDDVQHIISSINDNLMEFNILEITGMGNQEIKHSNILGWLFEDSEHNLEYYILDNFLKKVIEKNRKNDENNIILDNLQSYIYLADKKKDIIIYREKDNIDLLMVDEANKIVITIENKVDTSERTEGKDGGQLSKYENIINNKYKSKSLNQADGYDKYFIFLTIDLEEPLKGNEYWMRANHQMISNVIEEILRTKKDVSNKSKIILESYVDLLKRNGVVKDKNLEELCKQIWNKKEYSDAFEIILNNKPSKADEIKRILKSQNIKFEEKLNSGVHNFFIKFDNSSLLIYRLLYDSKGKGLNFCIVVEPEILIKDFIDTEIDKIKLNKHPRLDNDPGEQFGYKFVSSFTGYKISDKETTEDRVRELLIAFEKFDNEYINN